MQLGMTGNKIYILNGALLILLFLTSRVMFVPITVTIYAAQYHQWNLVTAMSTMRVICHLGNALQCCFQTYWFVLLVGLAARVVRTSWFQTARLSTRTTTQSQDIQFHIKNE
jgi:hypothetical protein